MGTKTKVRSQHEGLYPANDDQYEERIIAKVTKENDGSYSFQRDDGWSFWTQKDCPVVPKAGDKVRFYGRGVGSIVRGLFINGVKVFYRTEAEQDAENKRQLEEMDRQDREKFEKNRENHDRRIAALPTVFRQRIEKFQKTKGDEFRVKYEGYELFCCEQAVVIAEALKTPEAIDKWRELDSTKQKQMVSAFEGDNHSGNTFGASTMLAKLYISQPEFVTKMHGALTPLVGCEAYGCSHGETNNEEIVNLVPAS